MCQFGDESKILEELELSEGEALTGFRIWKVPIKNPGNILKSLNQDYVWPKLQPAVGLPEGTNSEGIYNYNYYDYYYNYDNYYDYYYNYDYYYDYYYYGITKVFGKVFRYKEGYRSSLCLPTHLVKITKAPDDHNQKWLEKFNSQVEQVAKEYNCQVITQEEYK